MGIQGSLTPRPAVPQNDPGAATKYIPARSNPGMQVNTAPIPGAAEEPLVETPAGGEGGDGGEPQEPQRDSRRLALLAAEDRKLRARQTELRELQARVDATQKQLEERAKGLQTQEEREARRRRDPKFLLQEYGYNAEGALQYLLNGEKLTPEQELAAGLDQRLREQGAQYEERIAQLEQRLEQGRETEEKERQRLETERQKQAEQETVAEIEVDITDVIGTSPEEFAFVARAKDSGVKAVFAHMQDLSDKMYEETGRRPPVTPKFIERAVAEVEAAAVAEARETMQDQRIARKLGLGGRVLPQRPTTLTNRMPGGQVPVRRQAQEAVEEEAPANETATQKFNRVRGMVASALSGGRIK